MGSLGNSIQSLIRSLINNKSIRSNMTLTPISRTKGSLGGYKAVTESESASSTVFCIPTSYVQDKTELEKFGDLKTGELSLIIRDDQTLDTNDEVTFESQDYNIREIKPVHFNEVNVGNEIILSEKLS